MSITITIQGTQIEFPASAESANWSPAIIQFAQAVETALSGLAGAHDIAPQLLNIDASNPGTDIVTGLAFSTASVRGAEITYSVFRTTSTSTAYEFGTILLVYNPNGSVGSKWEVSRDYVGDGKISFTISDAGQVSYTTTTLSGTGHTGRLGFAAKALLQS